MAGDGSKAVVTGGGATATATGALVFQRVAHDAGGSWPMLTRSNYSNWAIVMQVMLEARHLWVAVSEGTAERETDRTALECVLCSVPPEMYSTLTDEATVKEAWEALKAMMLRQVGAGASSSSTSRSHGTSHGPGRGGRGKTAQGGGGRGESKDCRKQLREEAHLAEGGKGVGGVKDEALLTQACVLPAPTDPQLTASTSFALSAATVTATSTRPVAETASRPVAEGEVQPTPTQLPTKIHWVAQWDLPAET